MEVSFSKVSRFRNTRTRWQMAHQAFSSSKSVTQSITMQLFFDLKSTLYLCRRWWGKSGKL